MALSHDPLSREAFNLREARLQDCVLRFATLSTADLEAADMSGANLMHARLNQANLSAVNLSNACLDHAFFCGAILKGVNLRGASLRFATLSTANLQAAEMSDADLTHARLDQANLSAANLSNARLDYADFAGATLSAVNLSGASLQHAKNLTESQIKESLGDTTTILPPHLQGSVPWSPATRSKFEHRDLGSLPRVTAKAHSPIKSYNVQRWGAYLGSVVLVLTVLVWLHTIAASLLDTSRRQKGSEQFLAETSSNLKEGDQGLRAPEALIEKKATLEQRITANPTPRTDPVDQTDGAPDQKLAPERLKRPIETSAPIEPEVHNHAVGLATALGPSQPTADDLNGETEASEPPAIVLTETPPAAWPHAIVPDLPSSESSTLVRADLEQTPFSFGAEPPPPPPARNPARGEDNAKFPPQPLRNPLR